MKQADWYFDFISPFAYLQFKRLREFDGELAITPIPIVFGALLKHWGQLGPAEIEPKRAFTYRMTQWQADRAGIPFKMPPMHPFNPLPALRLCLAAGVTTENIAAVWDVIFRQGLQADAPEAVMAMASALGIDDPQSAMADETVKNQLRVNTEKAVANKIYGVPTFLINSASFWGVDATDMVKDYLSNPGLFETAEMQRISNMPMGTTRK